MNPLSRAIAAAPKPSSTVVVPRSFVEFARDWCGVDWEQYPAQRLIAGVVYDGEPIPDTPLARALFGGVAGPIEAVLRSTLVLVAGRRGGKTYALISLRLLHLMLTCDLSMVRPGQRPVALVVAPNKKLRQEAVNFALGAARAHPKMRDWLVLPKGTRDEQAPSEFSIRRPDGKMVTFEGGVATEGGYGGRGRSLVALALDECAFFRDKSAVVNDEDILKAAKVAVLPGGQIIIASSPWAKRGVLWTEYSANFGHPVRAVAVHAPTTLLNPSKWIADAVARERSKDPDAARYEYDAEFLESGTSVFFDEVLIESMIDDSLNAGRAPVPGELVKAGGDLGFRSDSASLVVGADDGDQLRAGLVLEKRPEPGRPLVVSETAQAFGTHCAQNGVTYYTADGHYWDAAIEFMPKSTHCAQATHAPHEYFVKARIVMRERAKDGRSRVRIPRNERLIRQLREVEARPTAGGGMQIHMPRWRTGGHGDICQALVLMVAAFGGELVKPAAPTYGTPEWEAAEKEKRRKEFQRQKQQDGRYEKAPWRRG